MSQHFFPILPYPHKIYGGVLIVLCALCVVFMVTQYSVSGIVAYGVAINLSAGVLFVYDKIIASTRVLRMPHHVILAAAAAGAAVTLLVLAIVIRHKTRTDSVILPIALMAALYSVAVVYWMQIV